MNVASAPAPDIRFECGACGQPVRVTAEAAGLIITCPQCRGELEVPAFLTEAQVVAPREAPAPRPEEGDSSLARLTAELGEARRAARQWEEEANLAGRRLAEAREREQARKLEMEAMGLERLQAQGELAEVRSQLAAVHTEAMRWEEKALAAAHEQAALHLRLGTAAEEAATAARERAALAEDLLRAEASLEALERTSEAMHEETATLRRQLSDSESGREMLRLREAHTAATAELARLGRALREAEGEAARERQGARQLEGDFRTYRQRAEAGRSVSDESAEAELRHDATVLRGLVERQKAELEEQRRLLARLRTAQLGNRLIWGLLWLGAAAGLVTAGWWMQRMAPLLRSWW